jgi:hypothetical protein
VSWSEAEVEAILELMRAGATVQTGGSRCHTTYFYREGAWAQESFDEGYTSESPTSEDAIRGLVAREPELFRNVLAAPRWRRFSAAFLAGEREAAREALRSALEYGDSLGHGKLLEAVLDWPEEAPSEEVVKAFRDNLRGFTAYHVFMGAAGWDRSPATGLKGVEFADQLRAMVGEAVGIHYLRAAFLQQAGDLAAAEREMLEEIARLPEGHDNRSYYEDQLERIRRRAREAR